VCEALIELEEYLINYRGGKKASPVGSEAVVKAHLSLLYELPPSLPWSLLHDDEP